MQQHIETFKSWTVVDRKQAWGHQILECQWVFVNKTEKHKELLKCKARLVVCENQQYQNDLTIRATTLITTALRVLLTLIAKFDFETLQMNAVNAFVHVDLNETMYIKMSFEYEKQGKILLLNKALYELKRSFIFWQKKFANELKKLEFDFILQEPCIIFRNDIICFFFVDDIVWTFRKNRQNEAMSVVQALFKVFTIEILGKLKWFFEMQIIRNRMKGLLWIFQNAYIEKICETLMLTISRCSFTSMKTVELQPVTDDEEISNDFRTLYQKKVGSILFAAIFIRPDVAFAASRHVRFNQMSGRKHHHAADRIIQYLYNIRTYCIRYGEVPDPEHELISFVCASDVSFVDNIIDRRSSQGYIMKLFNGPVSWRANRQDIVTTSSTETEFLTISQIAKETIYLSRLMKSLTLKFSEPLIIECDNAQTIRLLMAESLKLQTKLRHVDIHSHWLRQEVQRDSIQLKWMPIKRMIADGLTKALTPANFGIFVRMIGLGDESGLLNRIKEKDTLRQAFKKTMQNVAVFEYGFDM